MKCVQKICFQIDELFFCHGDSSIWQHNKGRLYDALISSKRSKYRREPKEQRKQSTHFM